MIHELQEKARIYSRIGYKAESDPSMDSTRIAYQCTQFLELDIMGRTSYQAFYALREMVLPPAGIEHQLELREIKATHTLASTKASLAPETLAYTFDGLSHRLNMIPPSLQPPPPRLLLHTQGQLATLA